MNELGNIIVGVGALLIGGLICSFLIVLNEHKNEIWEKIYEIYNRKDV